MKKYTLINPIIYGNSKEYDIDEELDIFAADFFWQKINKYTIDYTNNFIISFKDDDNNIFHYKINEIQLNDDTVKYILQKLESHFDYNPKNIPIVGGNTHNDISIHYNSSMYKPNNKCILHVKSNISYINY